MNGLDILCLAPILCVDLLSNWRKGLWWDLSGFPPPPYLITGSGKGLRMRLGIFHSCHFTLQSGIIIIPVTMVKHLPRQSWVTVERKILHVNMYLLAYSYWWLIYTALQNNQAATTVMKHPVEKGITVFNDPKRSKVNKAFASSNKFSRLKFNSWNCVRPKSSLVVLLGNRNSLMTFDLLRLSKTVIPFIHWALQIIANQ